MNARYLGAYGIAVPALARKTRKHSVGFIGRSSPYCGRQPVEARKEDTVMETEGNKEVIRRLYEEGYNARTLTVVDEVAAADVVLRGPVYGEGVSGPEAIKTIKDEINRYHEEGNTIQITYPEQIAEGESVATRYMLDWSGQKI
jgi:hypothetical protein